MLQIGPLTIGNTVVSTSGMMLMFMQPCSLPNHAICHWLAEFDPLLPVKYLF